MSSFEYVETWDGSAPCNKLVYKTFIAYLIFPCPTRQRKILKFNLWRSKSKWSSHTSDLTVGFFQSIDTP